MTTRLELQTIIRETLADATQWPNATIQAWIIDAIHDYSHYFPYVVEKTYNFTGAARSFTVSNLGMYGIDEFLAIINPPESAILSVGTIKKKPVVVDDKLEIKPICKICLSADHRVVDGAEGARFLALVRTFLERPLSMLLRS